MRLPALVLLWGPVAALMALIFAASSIPDPAPLPGDLSDKVAHLGAYALLGATIVHALAQGRVAQITWWHAAGAVALSALYGGLLELHQMRIPGRTPDWQDVIANAAGGIVGAAAMLVLRAWLVRRAPVERYTRGD